MQGFNTLWMPGTDHAGIATQAVVERRLLQEEKNSRHELGREGLVERIWQWKNEYEARISASSSRWAAAAIGSGRGSRSTRSAPGPCGTRFSRMFSDGLIYRGKRLVNWDTFLQTAVSDDEVFHETVKGHFWHFKLSGDRSAAGRADARDDCHHAAGNDAGRYGRGRASRSGRGAWTSAEAELQPEAGRRAGEKSKPDIQAQIDDVAERRRTMLPQLGKLRDMARAGRKVRLPLLNREIPLVADEWAKPELGTGCVKITPAHDPNDYEVGSGSKLPMINILNLDGTLNDNAGPYRGLTVAKARAARRGRSGSAGPAGREDRRPRNRAGPFATARRRRSSRYLADQWFVQDGRAGPIGDGRRDRRPREDHSRALCQGLSRLARREARLADQPATLVGTSDSDLVLQRDQRRKPI